MFTLKMLPELSGARLLSLSAKRFALAAEGIGTPLSGVAAIHRRRTAPAEA